MDVFTWRASTITYDSDEDEVVLEVPTSIDRHAANLFRTNLPGVLRRQLGEGGFNANISPRDKDDPTQTGYGVLRISAPDLLTRANPEELRAVLTNHAEAAQREAETLDEEFHATAAVFWRRLTGLPEAD